jgi:transcriptional regulator with XRE-family HTH domain
MITFGTFITRRRKDLGLTQKEVAVRIKQDDGKALSVQYLNDIEHGRRGAPPDYVIKQLARVLRLELDVVYFRAGAAPRHLEAQLQTEIAPPASEDAIVSNPLGFYVNQISWTEQQS